MLPIFKYLQSAKKNLFVNQFIRSLLQCKPECAGCPDLQWPALSGGDSEERQEGPQHIIIVEIILLPHSGLSLHIVLIVVQKLTPEMKRADRIKWNYQKKAKEEEVATTDNSDKNVPAVLLQGLGLIGTVEELPLKELNSNHGEDEHEEDVDDEDVEDVLQRVHDAVEHSLRNTHKHTQL